MADLSPEMRAVIEDRIFYLLALNGGEITYGDLCDQMTERGWLVDDPTPQEKE